MYNGPETPLAVELDAVKYRGEGESFDEKVVRIADTLAEDETHFEDLREVLGTQAFLPGGRIQSAIGSPRNVSAINCIGSCDIDDSMEGIMEAAKEAALTMKRGCGIGYNFSTIRPKGGHIVSLDSPASGPLSFMHIFDAVCKTVSSAGNRRGAQMAVLRVDHPDIEAFIEAKTNTTDLTAFNLSIFVTDEFMQAVEEDTEFELTFNSVVVSRVNARYLYDKLMRATWDWAEPGLLFGDTINKNNNLWYCEHLNLTNPCGEQPLPPYGACILGSFNLVKYVGEDGFAWDRFIDDIYTIVPAMNNVIDITPYPIEDQKTEAMNKRRMGLGVTGLANALEYLGMPYGSKEFLEFENSVLKTLANTAYMASSILAKTKGSFPMFDVDKYMESAYIKQLDPEVQDHIRKYGIVNSHLTSIAPTGTISLTADNVSGGLEPVFSHSYTRDVTKDGRLVTEVVEDYAYRVWGTKGKTAGECTIDEHLGVLLTAQKWVDSACSKTINVGEHVSWDDFKDIYMKAWKGGAKGCTTFRAAGKRYGVLNTIKPEACYIDTKTGQKECG